MGCAIEEAISRTQTALETLDPALACRIIQGDDAFDEMERRIEQECLDLVVTQAPVAGDWRRIASVMRMIADLGALRIIAATSASMCCAWKEGAPGAAHPIF